MYNHLDKKYSQSNVAILEREASKRLQHHAATQLEPGKLLGIVPNTQLRVHILH